MLNPTIESTVSADIAVTVLFSTRNRATALGQVLDCFTSLEAPRGGWKLIVVDNGSTDTTVALLQGYRQKLPLTVLTEPQPGKNRALNTALPHLDGSLIVLTDDDVLPEPDWLCRLQDAAIDHPDCSLFGGTVLPHWSVPRPAWLTEQAVPFSVLYAQQKRAEGACRCDAIFGPNMAVRRSVFDAGFRFSEAVGPDESRQFYAMGGETEFLRRVEAAGYRSWFAPSAVVGHIIRPEQVEEQWILHRGYRYGFGEGRHYATGGSAGPIITPRLRVRALVYGVVAKALAILPCTPWRLKIRYKAQTLAGTIEALRRESQQFTPKIRPVQHAS